MKWINARSRRPKKTGVYLAAIGLGVFTDMFWNDSRKFDCEKVKEDNMKVEYWMPLPNPPKKNK